MKLVFTRGLVLAAAAGAVIAAASGLLAQIFFPDTASNVYVLTRQIFFIYGFCIPLVMICNVLSNYLQASGHNIFVNFQSLFDGFFGMVIPALLLAPRMGAMGVWLANPIGILLTILLVPVYICIYWKGIPSSFDQWLLLKPSFGVSDKDRLELPIRSMDDVVRTAETVQVFCRNHGTSDRIACFSALCLEETASNVVKHGFSTDKKTHNINCRVIYTDTHILLRVKDDCIAFNPKERADMILPEDPTKNIGIRMVCRLAEEVTYQNLLGLNVLTILLADKSASERSA